MENTNLGGQQPVTEGVSASTEAQTTSPAVETQATEALTKNLKAEMNRKFSKINEQLSKLVQFVETSQVRTPVEEAEITNVPDYKRYVDARFQETTREQVRKGQEENWNKALEVFPELNQNSDSFDEKFYKIADKYYGSFDLAKDPEAPIKAVKLAALELGKIEKLAQDKFLKDEARRSRILAEGATSSRDSKKDRDPKVDDKAVARLGINPDKLKARIKANKDKYGE